MRNVNVRVAYASTERTTDHIIHVFYRIQLFY